MFSRTLKLTSYHRRRIKTEVRAKVVASVWGEEFNQFLAALAVLPTTILKNNRNSSFSFKSSCTVLSFLKLFGHMAL